MKMSKIAAIVAAAALLVIGAAFTSMAATYDWQLENGEWVCYNKDGDQYYDTWAQSASGEWYHLGDEGVMDTNKKVQWKSATEKYVYVGADGSIQKDLWVKLLVDEDEDTYKWFRFDSNGYMLKSTKKTIDGSIYCFDADGQMLTGWVVPIASGSAVVGYKAAADYTEGVYYCGGADEGAAATGWKQIDIADEDEDPSIKWFYFSAKGVKTANQIKKINGSYYSFDKYGVMNSEWAYASKSAPIASQSYFSNPEDGARVSKGWFRAYAPGEDQDLIDDGDATLYWYYATSAGKLTTDQIKKINGKYYCFNENGQMLSGLVVVKATGSDFSAQALTDEISGLNCDNLVSKLKEKDFAAEDKALYFFSGDGENDGSMKFGTQKVTFDEEEFTLYFGKSTGTDKGKALNSKDAKAIYANGVKITADSELKYGFIDKTYTDLTVYSAATMVNKKADWDNYVCINAAGRTLTSLNSKDGDDYKITIKDSKISDIKLAD